MAELGYGIIGCGNIAPIHAQSVTEVENARLVAVSDVREETAQKLAAQYGGEVYTDYHEMLKRGDLDAVSICVPSGMRLEIARDCAEAGKHILAEKPLEVSTERIDQLIAATEKAGVTLGCVFQHRLSEAACNIREAIKQNRFGKLVLGDAYVKWYRSQEYYDSGDWRGTWKLDGGGCLMNQGIHQIDLLLSFFGPVKSITAQTALVAHERLEVEDLATAMLTFESGAMGVVEGSTAIWPGHPARVEVHGAQGSAIIEDGALSFWQFQDERPEDKEIQEQMNAVSEMGSGSADPIAALKHEGHLRQIRDFVQALQEGRAPAVEGREGRLAVEVIEAIYRSAKTGEPVTLGS